VLGTGGKVLTADARLLPKKTAAITDLGRTGSIVSVGGFDPDTKVKEFMTGVPAWSKESGSQPEAQGVYFEVNEQGEALSIASFRIVGKEIVNERESTGQGN